MNTIQAMYVGNGCFIRNDDNKLAFVKKQNRPDDLRVGVVYELAWSLIDRHGVLFYVYAEAA